MYFAIRDAGELTIKEINGGLSNKFETYNEIKIVKTKVNGEVKVYILMFNEVTNAKSLIMAHGGRYLEDKLVISDYVDDREYRAAQLASIRQMSGQVSRGSAGDYQADERAGVARLSWRVSGR